MTYSGTEWKIGVVSQVTPYFVTIDGVLPDFRDRVIKGLLNHFSSVSQYVYTFFGRDKIHIFRVAEIARNEKPYGDSESDKYGEYVRLKAVPYGTFSQSGFVMGVHEFPMVGDYAYAAPYEVVGNILGSRGELALGSILGALEVEARIDPNSLFGGHTGVFGNTGSGKSTTVRFLLDGLAELFASQSKKVKKDTKVIVLDLHGDYEFLAENHRNVLKISSDEVRLDPSDLSLEDWFNTLLPAEGVQRPFLERALRYAALNEKGKIVLKAAFALNALYNLGTDGHEGRKTLIRKFIEPLKSSLEPAVKGYYAVGNSQVVIKTIEEFLNKVFVLSYGNLPQNAIDNLVGGLRQIIEVEECLDDNNKPNIESIISKFSDPSAFSSIETLSLALETVFDEEQSLGNLSARSYSQGLSTRIKGLSDRLDDKVFGRTTGDTLIRRIQESPNLVVIDLSDLNDDDALTLVANCLLRSCFASQRDMLKSQGSRSGPMTFVLDEAHRYIRSDNVQGDSIFDRIAREGRKFGLYLFFISQIPSEVSRVVIAQATAFVLHRIQNSTDLDFLKRNLPAISEVEVSRLPLFSPGQALLAGATIGAPLEVVVRGDFKDMTPSLSMFT